MSTPDTLLTSIGIIKEERNFVTVLNDSDKTAPPTEDDAGDRGTPVMHGPQYLTGMRLFVVFCSLLLSVLLTNLDQTIVATSLPRIVSVFDALDLAIWVAAAYFLTQAGLMLCVGQLTNTVPIKTVYIASVIIFEVGSVICGAAQSMQVLIFGRAVAGAGAAGITICSIGTISTFTRMEVRSKLFGCFGTVLAVAAIVGPILGGAFTDHVSWRWCFYINLPLGGISVVIMCVWLPYHQPDTSSLLGQSIFYRFNYTLDWVGTVLCLGFSACLLLGLEWGGAVKPWNSAAVITPLCILGVLVILFLLWEGYRGVNALVPYSLFYRRTQCGACLEAFWLLTAHIVLVYYLPLWYQINGRDSIQSGIDIIPLMLSFIVASGIAAWFTTTTGRYWHIMLLSPLITVVGAVLLFETNSDTSAAKMLGYQILAGAGVGGSFQLSFMAVQAEWADEPQHTTRASAVLTFVSYFGAILGLGIAGAIYNNQLGRELSHVPGLSTELISTLKESVTVISTLPDGIRDEVRAASARALRGIFVIPLVCSVMAAVSALAIRDYDLRERAKLVSGESANAVPVV